MAVGAKEKPVMSLYLRESNKIGDFNPRMKLSGSCFVISECLSSGLSSAELAPSAIPIERATDTPQSGAPNSSPCSKYTMADVIGLA